MPSIDPKKVEDAVEVVESVASEPKSFYKSKRFWIALAAAGLDYTGYLPAPYAVAITLAANVLMPIFDKARAK